jgi:hypothetical protein
MGMIENKCAHLLEKSEYREDALNYMMKMQYDLQKFVALKRGNLDPDAHVNLFTFAKESIYYWGCLTTEYAELQERDWASNPSDELLLETQFEYIDMFHFLMNFFIFSKQTSFEQTLEDLYDNTPDPFCEPYELVEKQWSALSTYVGEYIDLLPYKHWKTYDSKFEVDAPGLAEKTNQILYSFIVMGKALGIDKEHFYNLYVSKNKENINRQNNNY